MMIMVHGDGGGVDGVDGGGGGGGRILPNS